MGLVMGFSFSESFVVVRLGGRLVNASQEVRWVLSHTHVTTPPDLAYFFAGFLFWQSILQLLLCLVEIVA